MVLPRKLAFPDKFVYELVQEMGLSCDGAPILFPDNTTPIKFLVEFNQDEFTRVLSALMTGADLSYPNTAHDVVWLFLRQVECPVSLCDELIECLQPLFDALETKLDTIEEKVDNVQESLDENALKPPEPIENNIEGEICGGATAVVKFMNDLNEKTYADIENSLVDNVFEVIPIVLEAIPVIGELPVDEIFDLANWYFENQAVDYTADFEAIKSQIICDLKCFVEINSGIFTFDVWQEWLEYVGTAYPGNRAASVFSRFTEVSLTFANRLAQVIFNQPTLQDYFNSLYQQYFAGTQNPVSCSACECPDLCAFVVESTNDPIITPVDSGIAVVMGQSYIITAVGTWSIPPIDSDADGIPGSEIGTAVLPSARLAQLILKTDITGGWEPGGVSFTYVAPSTGNLYFAMNDISGAYGDNTGSMCINIELAP